MADLTGSWLAFRLGVDPVRIDRMRKAGELYGVRCDSGEWQYPSWQFDEAGKTKPAVARLLANAREQRLSALELTELFDRKVGLVGGKRVRELLERGGTTGSPAKRQR
jgi:hypothetical protein